MWRKFLKYPKYYFLFTHMQREWRRCQPIIWKFGHTCAWKVRVVKLVLGTSYNPLPQTLFGCFWFQVWWLTFTLNVSDQIIIIESLFSCHAKDVSMRMLSETLLIINWSPTAAKRTTKRERERTRKASNSLKFTNVELNGYICELDRLKQINTERTRSFKIHKSGRDPS